MVEKEEKGLESVSILGELFQVVRNGVGVSSAIGWEPMS